MSDGLTYTEQPSVCDGTLAATKSTRQCEIDSDYFINTLGFTWGASVYAKVMASNIKGNSAISLAGNGANILRIPDAPQNLANVPSLTTGTTIGLTWTDG
jgi:hypothetical protein